MPTGGHIAIVSSTASWQLAPDSPLIKTARTKELSTAELDKLAESLRIMWSSPSDNATAKAEPVRGRQAVGRWMAQEGFQARLCD